MARVQVTGPIWHFVQFPGDTKNVWFLGTAKQTPKLRIDQAYSPIRLEQGGKILPFDLVYQGKQAKVLTQINYVDYSVAYALGCSPRYTRSRFALGRGLVSYRDIGSMALGNKGYFTLFLCFPFAGSVNDPPSSAPSPLTFGAFNMPLVYRFPACQIEHEEQVGGTGEQEYLLGINVLPIFYQRAKYKQTFKGSPLAGGLFLYDHRQSVSKVDLESALKKVSDSSLKNRRN